MNEDLSRLLNELQAESDLLEELKHIDDNYEFDLRLIEIGRSRGLNFDENDILEIAAQGRRSWLERWI